MFRSTIVSSVVIMGLTAPLAGISNTADATVKPRQEAAAPRASGSKILTRLHRFESEPVRILDVRVKGQSVRLGPKAAQFDEASDWLRGLVVRFKNVSDKPVASVEFHLTLADPETSADVINFTLKYGQTPPGSSPDMTEPLMPGASAEVVLSESWYDQANESLRQSHNTPVTMVDRADLKLSNVYFNDGTAWRSK